MHEGDHGILDDTNKEFEAKFGCTDCKSANQAQKQEDAHQHNDHPHPHPHADDHGHDHPHPHADEHSHDHPHPHPHADDHGKPKKSVEIVSGIIVGLLILGFVIWKFFIK